MRAHDEALPGNEYKMKDVGHGFFSRFGRGFCVIGSRTFQEVWVTDFARLHSHKIPFCRAFWFKAGTRSLFWGIWLGQLAGGCHAHSDALEDRARPLFSDASTACDIFTCREHAVGRAGCTGARIVRKV